MKSMNLPKISTRRIKFSHASNPSSGKNILNRNFSVNTPNTVWVSDITYIRLIGYSHIQTLHYSDSVTLKS